MGVLRGIEVQSTWRPGEYTWNFQSGLRVGLTNPRGMVSNGLMSCPQNRAFSIKWNSGPLSGQTWAGMYTSWQQGPVTAEWAFAFAPNTSIAAPISIEEAMAGNGYMVFSVSSCLKGKTCSFNPTLRNAALVSPAPTLARALRGLTTDPCNAFSTCSTCIGATSGLCGWCDTPVVYADGSKGYNCAGYDSSGKPSPSWTCHVQYRRYSCFDYKCDWTNFSQPTCQPLPDGVPGLTKEQCQLGCQPTQALYKCDNQTFQCTQCNVKYCRTNLDCPGSYCQIDTSKPGPYICHGGIPGGCDTQSKCAGGCVPPPWNGTWRGIQIDTSYTRGEYDWTFYADQQIVAVRTPTMGEFEATIKLGQQSTVSEGTAIVLTVTKSNNAGIVSVGQKFYGLFSIVTSDKNKNLKYMFIGFDTTQPGSFVSAQNGKSFMLQHCFDALGCDFSPAKVSPLQ